MDGGSTDDGCVEIRQHQVKDEDIEASSLVVQEGSETWEDLYQDDFEEAEDEVVSIYLALFGVCECFGMCRWRAIKLQRLGRMNL